MATPCASDHEPDRRRAWSLPWRALSAAVALSVLVPLSWVQSGPAFCPLRRYADLPCPGCGGTRAFSCMGHGEWAMAFEHHPFAAILWLATATFAVGAMVRWIWPGALAGWSLGRRAARWLLWAFLGSWLVWGVWRLCAAAAA